MMIRLVLGVVGAALAIAGQADRKLLPVDEARRDPVIKAFSERLMVAARREAVPNLLELTAESIRVDEDDLTREAFAARIAGMDRSARALFWQQLRDAVTLGMAYDREYSEPTLVAPYVSVLLAPMLDSDPEALAITGRKVAVHRRADAASAIVGHLDYDIVSRGPEGNKAAASGAFGGGMYEWVHIRMPDSRVGWVASKYVHSVGEATFVFRQVRGAWKLIAWGMSD